MRRPPPLVLLAGVLGLSLLVALVVGVFGGLDQDTEDTWSTSASVVEAAACDRPDARETVSFTHDGTPRLARLDACGHRVGESLQVAVSSGDVVHLATAGAGASGSGRPMGMVLLVAAALAGAGYVRMHQRISRAGAGV